MTMELAEMQNRIFNKVADNTDRYVALAVIEHIRFLDNTKEPIPFGDLLKRIRAENPEFYKKLEASD